MENASKALILAGGILIGILIISLGVYIINISTSFSEKYDDRIVENEINTHNNKFLIYAKDITPQEMVSLYNLVKENNNKYIDRKVVLKIDGTDANFDMIEIMQGATITETGEQIKVEAPYKLTKVLYNETTRFIKQMEYITN